MEEKEEKHCLNCGEPVGPGRRDKKYCSDPCKTEYNNRQKDLNQPPAETLPAFIEDINRIVLVNWKILKECLGTGETCIMRANDLSGRSFNFKYFSSVRRTTYNEDLYFFCYDMGYKFVGDDEKVLIVQSDQMVRLTGPAFQPPKADRLG